MASRRQYLTQTELAEYADITISDSSEADDRISQAEEIIDAYVGFQDKFVQQVWQGKLTSATSTVLTDSSSDTPLNFQDNYFTFCEVEIIGGIGSGQREIIASSDQDNKTITIRTAFDTAPDSTSVYKIYQLGKFPRLRDYFFEPDTETYYKSIPEAVKRATAAQVEYVIAQGDNFFKSDQTDKLSESIGNYSYSKGQGGSTLSQMIAPKARALLKGIRNATGRLIAENPTDVYF